MRHKELLTPKRIMKISSKELISMLPLGSKLKQELLEKFDTLDDAKRISIIDMLWQTYDSLFEVKLQENVRNALFQIEDGQEKIGPDFYKRIQEKTRKEMEQQLVKDTTELHLSAVRDKLKNLIEKE